MRGEGREDRHWEKKKGRQKKGDEREGKEVEKGGRGEERKKGGNKEGGKGDIVKLVQPIPVSFILLK